MSLSEQIFFGSHAKLDPMALAYRLSGGPLGVVDYERHLVIERCALVRHRLLVRLDLDHLGDDVPSSVLVLDNKIRNVKAHFFF